MNEMIRAALELSRTSIREEAEEVLKGILLDSPELHLMEEGFLHDMTTHRSSLCVGSYCSIHNPSDHALRHALRYWDDQTRAILRLCPHAEFHPDPDDLAFKMRTYPQSYVEMTWGEHPCDGCCGGSVIDGEVIITGPKEIEG